MRGKLTRVVLLGVALVLGPQQAYAAKQSARSVLASRCAPAVFLDFHRYREGGSPELSLVCRPSRLRVAPDHAGAQPYTLSRMRWHSWGASTTYTDATAFFCPNMSPCEHRQSRLTVTGLEIRHGHKYLYRAAYLKVEGLPRMELWVG